MTQHFALSYQHLYHKQAQCYREEIHELLIIFFENNGLELFLIQLPYVIDDGIQSEFVVAGMDIGPISGLRNFLQRIFIQFGNDNIAFGVFQKPVFIGIGCPC